VEKCRPCLVFATFTLAFALQLMKKYRKTAEKSTEKLNKKRNDTYFKL
jgi:hypothetical protein